jgi:hypothetical protein
MYLLSATCGTYVIILEIIIISEQKVIIFIYWGYLVSSDVLLLKKNYIPLLIYNSDELVMSRENRKIFTYAFCKSGALQMDMQTHTHAATQFYHREIFLSLSLGFSLDKATDALSCLYKTILHVTGYFSLRLNNTPVGKHYITHM